jgi:hypothetical protein
MRGVDIDTPSIAASSMTSSGIATCIPRLDDA